MVDFHVHCDYSVDAEGSVDDYARAAIARGLAYICFTTHCDLDPARRSHDGKIRHKGRIVDVTSDWLESYIDEVSAARKAYAGRGLGIMCGLEIGFVPGIEDMIESVTDSHGFDFIIGGVHTLEGVDIVSAGECMDYFRTRTPVEVCKRYYHDLLEAVRSGVFDSIAHLDIYKRCGLDFYGEALNDAHLGFVEPVLDEIAARGTCLEINSGSLRKGLAWPYPSADLMGMAGQAGIAGVTVGSDCHRPGDVGSGLGECLRMALGAGYRNVEIFSRRSSRPVPIRKPYDEAS
jgi:histidinol-phosphatase (PHP family)